MNGRELARKLSLRLRKIGENHETAEVMCVDPWLYKEQQRASSAVHHFSRGGARNDYGEVGFTKDRMVNLLKSLKRKLASPALGVVDLW